MAPASVHRVTFPLPSTEDGKMGALASGHAVDNVDNASSSHFRVLGRLLQRVFLRHNRTAPAPWATTTTNNPSMKTRGLREDMYLRRCLEDPRVVGSFYCDR